MQRLFTLKEQKFLKKLSPQSTLFTPGCPACLSCDQTKKEIEYLRQQIARQEQLGEQSEQRHREAQILAELVSLKEQEIAELRKLVEQEDRLKSEFEEALRECGKVRASVLAEI